MSHVTLTGKKTLTEKVKQLVPLFSTSMSIVKRTLSFYILKKISFIIFHYFHFSALQQFLLFRQFYFYNSPKNPTPNHLAKSLLKTGLNLSCYVCFSPCHERMVDSWHPVDKGSLRAVAIFNYNVSGIQIQTTSNGEPVRIPPCFYYHFSESLFNYTDHSNTKVIEVQF